MLEKVGAVQPWLLEVCKLSFGLWAFLEGLFSIWQNVEPTVANNLCYWANFCCSKYPNLEQIIWPSGHTDSEMKYLGILLSLFDDWIEAVNLWYRK